MTDHRFCQVSQSRFVIAIIAVGMIASLGSDGAKATPPNLRTVALSGTDGVFGPGMGTGVVFEFVDSPAMNLSGQVAFRGTTVAGSGLPNGVWMRPDATETSFNSNLALEAGPQPAAVLTSDRIRITASISTIRAIQRFDSGHPRAPSPARAA